MASVGNVGGDMMNLSVYPFIIRAVTLHGIGSQDFSMEDRIRLWSCLAGDWKPEKLGDIQLYSDLGGIEKF